MLEYIVLKPIIYIVVLITLLIFSVNMNSVYLDALITEEISNFEVFCNRDCKNIASKLLELASSCELINNISSYLSIHQLEKLVIIRLALPIITMNSEMICVLIISFLIFSYMINDMILNNESISGIMYVSKWVLNILLLTMLYTAFCSEMFTLNIIYFLENMIIYNLSLKFAIFGCKAKI